MEKDIHTLSTGETVKEITLKNKNGIIIKILNYGGIIKNLYIPDRNGNLGDIVLGFDNFEPYIENPPYFSAIIGRVANRISNGKFIIDGKEYKINTPFKDYSLHGGIKGFDKKIWKVETYKIDGEEGVELNYLSPDGEEGFPGNLKTRVIYRLNDNNEFITEYFAETDKATHVNLTNHAYFNLSGKENIYDHELLIKADKITETDERILPTGKFVNIKSTPYDFTKMHAIGKMIDKTENGYDDCYVFDKPDNEMAPVAKVYDPNSERIMEVYTTYPSLQLYTGNFLNNIKGKKGKQYANHSALCLETQLLPDAANRPEFPTTLLKPGDIYSHATVLRFGVAN
jgi:aldose 1-epimerase